MNESIELARTYVPDRVRCIWPTECPLILQNHFTNDIFNYIESTVATNKKISKHSSENQFSGLHISRFKCTLHIFEINLHKILSKTQQQPCIADIQCIVYSERLSNWIEWKEESHAFNQIQWWTYYKMQCTFQSSKRSNSFCKQQ